MLPVSAVASIWTPASPMSLYLVIFSVKKGKETQTKYCLIRTIFFIYLLKKTHPICNVLIAMLPVSAVASIWTPASPMSLNLKIFEIKKDKETYLKHCFLTNKKMQHFIIKPTRYQASSSRCCRSAPSQAPERPKRKSHFSW